MTVSPQRGPFVLATVNRDNNQHSPNENIRLGNFVEGIRVILAILAEEILYVHPAGSPRDDRGLSPAQASDPRSESCHRLVSCATDQADENAVLTH
jgi:hypothetical protein